MGQTSPIWMGLLPKVVIITFHAEEHVRAGRQLGFTMYLDVSVVASVLSDFILSDAGTWYMPVP